MLWDLSRFMTVLACTLIVYYSFIKYPFAGHFNITLYPFWYKATKLRLFLFTCYMFLER